MGRTLNYFELPGVQGEDSSLSVVYHFRGQNAGQTNFMVKDAGGNGFSFVLKSKEDAINLANYLFEEANYQNQPQGWTSPSFEITKLALMVMCNGIVMNTLYDHHILSQEVDSFNYNILRKAFPEYDSEDYYFVIYGLRENGLSRDSVEKCISACLDYQRDVLISGDLRLFKPMVLRDIEDMTGLDISTVSRAVKGCRIYTAHRNYSLESVRNDIVSLDFPTLFNEPVNGQSSIAIKIKMRALIENEDIEHPLTDDELVELLSRFGYSIARRTVEKYRNGSLGIPNSNRRRIRR